MSDEEKSDSTPTSEVAEDRYQTGSYPYWLWSWPVGASLLTFVSIYAAWWGADFLQQPWSFLGGLLCAGVGVGSFGTVRDWLRWPGRPMRPWRSLLALFVVYGLIGGVALGLFLAFLAVMIVPWLAWIPDSTLRVLSGIIVGSLLSLVAWLESRQRAKRAATKGPGDKGSSSCSAEPQAAADGGRDLGSS